MHTEIIYIEIINFMVLNFMEPVSFRAVPARSCTGFCVPVLADASVLPNLNSFIGKMF
jgi:hypothetical protein